VIELRYRIVDVFSDRPLAGNALCVVLDPCPEPVMQAIAREANLSETTFPIVVADDAYEMRIFTPVEELPFAGHPSLGTAWAFGPGRWTQTTSGATVVVEASEGGAVMGQPDPTYEDLDPEPITDALGLRSSLGAWLATAGGMRHVIVPTDAPINGIVPDLTRLRPGCTNAVVSRVDDGTLQVRVFVRGIGEDPGTGSAAGPIALLARKVFGTAPSVTIHQGADVGRPCRIEVDAVPGAIRVGGRVVACAEGRFTL
jgi:trans-2,3-dihydro-3-hydroxyanthranilate isomerase